jgi:hypothetical protein
MNNKHEWWAVYLPLPENLAMPCACGARQNGENTRQNFRRVLAHGEHHTATQATANDLCHAQITKPTTTFSPCASSRPTVK